MAKKLFKSPATDLRDKTPKIRCEVTYRVSYEYNGGIVIEGEWYNGFEVPPPLLASGYKLVGIGVGLQLNARPPLATARLVKI